jgi:hypothetical protein
MPPPAKAGLEIVSLGRLGPALTSKDERAGNETKWRRVQAALQLDPDKVVIKQLGGAESGNTSIRNASPLVWKDKGYFQRARDLGQVFTVDQDFTLDAVILRTGNAHLAYLPGTAGAEVMIQFFEVTGTPAIHDNGTPKGTSATHGFSTNHRCDDFITGITFKSLRVVEGGIMPDIGTMAHGKLTYLKWDLTGDDELRFEGGKRYAFMVGFTHPDADRNFTLSNRNNAASPKKPSLDDGDLYSGGWALRREGNGHNPPLMVPGEAPPADPVKLARLRAESSFPEGAARYAASPTTDGYPDVDTYRDLEFLILCK